jgi:crotonobetainyl-CoA:carnitine CoA-transferase CaiB-like acyl-CoA transferase
VFATSDGYVVVAARDEKFWRNLCDAVGRPDLKDDPRTADNSARVANREYVVSILEEIFASRTRTEWLEILDANDIPNAPVNDIEEVFSDEQVLARGMVQSYEHPTVGTVRYPPTPVKFAGLEYPKNPAPMLGEHTAEILSDRLGLDREGIADLIRKGVVHSWSPSAIDE